MSKKSYFLLSFLIFNCLINFNLNSIWTAFTSQEGSDGQDFDYEMKRRERLYNQHTKKWNAINEKDFSQDTNFETVSNSYDRPAEDWFINNWINTNQILDKDELQANYQKYKRDADYNYLQAKDLQKPKNLQARFDYWDDKWGVSGFLPAVNVALSEKEDQKYNFTVPLSGSNYQQKVEENDPSQAQYNRNGKKFNLYDDKNLASTLRNENKELANVVIPQEQQKLLYAQAKNLALYSVQAAAIAKLMKEAR